MKGMSIGSQERITLYRGSFVGAVADALTECEGLFLGDKCFGLREIERVVLGEVCFEDYTSYLISTIVYQSGSVRSDNWFTNCSCRAFFCWCLYTWGVAPGC